MTGNLGGAYDLLADRWLDEQFSRVDGVPAHQRAVGFLGPHRGGWSLNVGCGCNTRFNALLREQGLQLEGVGISARMVALARAADPMATIHHADACAWQPPRRYRFISAWDSIWHVPLDQQRALMLTLLAALEPEGVLLFTAGGLDAPGEHWDATMGPSVYYASLGTHGLLDVIREAGCACRHLEFDQWPQKHLVVIVQRPA